MKGSERIDAVLEPALTKWDRRVLRALNPEPAEWDVEQLRRLAVSEWTVAETLRVDDVALVRRTLRGLNHLGFASVIGRYDRPRWLRLAKGSDALGLREDQR